MTNDAPVSVAEWPPLGVGGTPSICGKAQSHLRSTIIDIWKLQFLLFRQFKTVNRLTFFFLHVLLLSGSLLAVVIHHLLAIAHVLHHLLLIHVHLLLLIVHLHLVFQILFPSSFLALFLFD